MKAVLIAGEQSGDLIGAEIITALQDKTCEIYGVGGEAMLKAGLKKSFFPISEIAVMGFVEVLPKVFKIKSLIKETAKKIFQLNPNFVITIDSPGFNTRLAGLLRKDGFTGKIYHAVAPTVWAYDKGRAKKFAKLFDKLFCILPFEPPFFLKEGLEAKYICYPPLLKLLPFLIRTYTEEKYFILTMGSREVEIFNNIDFGKKIINLIKKKFPEAKFVLPTFERFKNILEENFKDEIIITSEEEKIKYLQKAYFSISKSGTGAIENSFFKIPSIIYYKVNIVSYLIIKSIVKVKYANLINILLGKCAIPEFIQYDVVPEKIAQKIFEICDNEHLKNEQLESIEKAKKMLLQGILFKNFGEGVVSNL